MRQWRPAERHTKAAFTTCSSATTSVARMLLGAAEANKIQADTDHEKTGGMYLRINQFGDQCTVDASVAKYARAKRTWRSGHYFYEPLVSGGNLLGVWVLPEEYRKIGFFWEMDSGKCFRIERRAFPAGPYTFMRQSTEVAGKISFGLYGKVSNDPESAPIPVQKLTKQILEDSEKDRTLCYNNFMDPCPELTKEQVAICKGFDYGDKTLKLPCGPLPWPAGCPEPGYVPKTNPLHGRWITVSGGQSTEVAGKISFVLYVKVSND